MRRVKEHEPVQMFKFIDGLVISVPDGIVDYFGLSAKMLWFAGCKRTKKKVVLTFVSPLSPATPTPPHLTSTIRGEFKRKKYKKQKQPFTLIKEMEALRKKQLKKKKKGFKPDWFG